MVGIAVGTALVGVLLFGFAEYLPTLFPPAFLRLIGFAGVITALPPFWVAFESWLPLLLLVVPCLTAMIAIHLVQTRHASQLRSLATATESVVPVVVRHQRTDAK